MAPGARKTMRRNPPTSPSSGDVDKTIRHSKGRRYRGLTCANCRARKVKCDGSQPACKTCEVYHDECRYDKAPPMSQVVAMAQRLQEAERMIADFRARSRSVTSEEPSASPGGDDDDGEPHSPLLETPAIPPDAQRHLPSQFTGSQPTTFPSHVPAGRASISWPRIFTSDPRSPEAHRSPVNTDPEAAGLSVDEHGKICYYGPTSAVHDPPHPDQAEAPASITYPSFGRASTRDQRPNFVREMATWEDFALGNASLQTCIPRPMLAKLLRLHWTWVSYMFMWVYRPAFIRDMATGGPYYSEFLLTVMCGHAAKYQESSNCSDFLLARARRLLGAAIQQPSSIPTVQALLQLSARDLAHGSLSQAWVYSGIAFRMASDLGLQHSGSTVKGLSPLDLEIRRRLFWGCYFWDKATSLYAGRLPAVTEVLDTSSLDLLDYSTEDELWAPFYGDSADHHLRDRYPPRKGHGVSCFVNSCKLSIIINDIVVKLYSRKQWSMTEAALQDIKERLDLWRSRSPPHLKYDPDNLPVICPPPHLISQNLLYYTSVILAHRPFWSMPTYYQICIKASESIEKLVLLMESTFGLDNITYLMGYCIYTGASAILEDAKNGNDAAHATLQTYLRALNTGMRRCPLLERSLNIIIKGMNSASPPRSPFADRIRTDDATGTVNMFIPAFPYTDPVMPIDFDMNAYWPNLDSFSGLDCFPEAQMDLNEFTGHT